MPRNEAKAERTGRRVSQQERQSRVLRMKMTGASDREIARQLAADPDHPIKVSHKTVNLDWHAALDREVEQNLEQASRLRMLATVRLERLLAAHWGRAIGVLPGQAPHMPSAELCRRIIGDIRALYGLDRELGDPERPLTIQGDVNIDFTQLADADLLTLIEIAEGQQRLALGPGGDGASPGGD